MHVYRMGLKRYLTEECYTINEREIRHSFDNEVKEGDLMRNWKRLEREKELS